MGGENPYIQQSEVTLPTTAYTIVFHCEGETKEVRVDPNALPKGDGDEGSLLRIGMAAGLKIDHACGGVCACSTCHVIVKEGLDSCNESTEDEEDMLDMAPGLTEFSRLACQTVPNGTVDLVVEVPDWNRNIVSEEH